MSIIFAGIVPHPPILIPSIGKENLNILDSTLRAYKHMEHELFARQPEVIVIISPHGTIIPSAFAVNLCSTEVCGDGNWQYVGNFEDFGDFSTELKYKNDFKLADSIQKQADNKVPVRIIDDPKLDHGLLVPLYYLAAHLPNIAIVPVSYCFLDYQAHLTFGNTLREILTDYDKRVAVIASGDLSHRLTKDAPAGYHASGEVFDTKVRELLVKNNAEEMAQIDEGLINEAGECGLRSILILMGLVSKLNCSFKQLSYEGPFGVGYLVGYYEFA